MVLTPEPTSLTDAYALIKVLKTNHGVERFEVCVNMAPDAKTAREMFVRLHQACDHFLSGVSLELAGVIPRDTAVRKAVVQQALSASASRRARPPVGCWRWPRPSPPGKCPKIWMAISSFSGKNFYSVRRFACAATPPLQCRAGRQRRRTAGVARRHAGRGCN